MGLDPNHFGNRADVDNQAVFLREIMKAFARWVILSCVDIGKNYHSCFPIIRTDGTGACQYSVSIPSNLLKSSTGKRIPSCVLIETLIGVKIILSIGTARIRRKYSLLEYKCVICEVAFPMNGFLLKNKNLLSDRENMVRSF